jgi:hypothetical protein
MSHFHFPKEFLNIDEFYGFLKNKIYPYVNNFMSDCISDEFLNNFTIRYHMREEFVKQFSWAIPSREAVRRIVDFAENDEILEIGAGTGLWSWLISEFGGKITACDIQPIHDCLYFNNKAKYFYPVKLSNDIISLAKDFKCHFYCWPSYSDSWSGEYLNTLMPEKVVYIGEGYGGCTGDDAFHDTLSKQYEMVDEYRLDQWYGIHDHLSLYKKKS